MDKEKEKAFQEALAAAVKEDREALAEMIVEWIDPVHITEEFTSRVLGTRALQPGDSLVKKIRKGIEVRTLVPGAVHLQSEITVSDRINWQLSGADIRVGGNMWDLENGDLGTIQSIKTEMVAKLHDYYIARIFNSLGTLWNATNTPDFYATVATEINKATLDNMIDTITYYAGSVKAIVATRYALNPMMDWAQFQAWPDAPDAWGTAVPSTVEEIQQTGRVGIYRGVSNIIGLRQLWDNPEDFTALFPNDMILVIGDNAGEFITYGGVNWKQWDNMEPTPPIWNLELYQQYGMIIDRIKNIGVIRIT